MIPAVTNPDRIAVVHDGGTATFREVAAQAVAVPSEGVVAVRAERSLAFVSRMLGAWEAGAIPAVLGEWPADRVRAAMAPFAAAHPLALDPDAGHVLFTSGTTGAPKGIVVGRTAFTAATRAFFDAMPIGETDRIAFLSRPGHDPSLRELLAPWHTGAILVIPDSGTAASPRLLAAWLERNAVTVIQAAPVLLQMLAEVTSRPLRSLRLVCSVGAPLTTAAYAAAIRLAPQAEIANCYGASETPQVVCVHRMPPGTPPPSGRSVPIGQPLGHAEVRVAPDGSLLVAADACALGYTDGAPLRVADDEGRLWYDTGDVVRRQPGGALVFERRRDRQVQINGTRVELGEIESTAARVPGVLEATATPVEDERGFGSVRLTVVPSPGAAVDTAALGDELRRRLDPAVAVSLAVPPAAALSLPALLQDCARTATGMDEVDPDAGFFDAGFTSLTLMQFVAEVSVRLDVELSPILVFRHPTMKSLADHLALRPGYDRNG